MSLPPPYARWVDVAVGGAPTETRAACGTCVMCARPGEAYPAGVPVFGEARCCTTTPELPSFLVGRILASDLPGRAAVEARIAARAGVTPLGLMRTAAEDVVVERFAGNPGGRSTRCPYHQADGTCGVWQHRNATCATWFCKHDRGAAAKEAWDAIRDLLVAVEAALAWDAALALDVGADALALLLEDGPVPPDVDPARHAAAWGGWAGREEAYYRAAAAHVDGMDWGRVLLLGGSAVAARAAVAREAWRRLGAKDLPSAARVAPWKTVAVGPEGVGAVTYSPNDPIGLPTLLTNVLPYFDGRPTDDALKAMADERGVEIDRDLLQSLVDWRVIVGRG